MAVQTKKEIIGLVNRKMRMTKSRNQTLLRSLEYLLIHFPDINSFDTQARTKL